MSANPQNTTSVKQKPTTKTNQKTNQRPRNMPVTMATNNDRAIQAALAIRWLPRGILDPVLKMDPILTELKTRYGIEPRLPTVNQGYPTDGGFVKEAVEKAAAAADQAAFGGGIGYGLSMGYSATAKEGVSGVEVNNLDKPNAKEWDHELKYLHKQIKKLINDTDELESAHKGVNGPVANYDSRRKILKLIFKNIEEQYGNLVKNFEKEGVPLELPGVVLALARETLNLPLPVEDFEQEIQDLGTQLKELEEKFPTESESLGMFSGASLDFLFKNLDLEFQRKSSDMNTSRKSLDFAVKNLDLEFSRKSSDTKASRNSFDVFRQNSLDLPGGNLDMKSSRNSFDVFQRNSSDLPVESLDMKFPRMSFDMFRRTSLDVKAPRKSPDVPVKNLDMPRMSSEMSVQNLIRKIEGMRCPLKKAQLEKLKHEEKVEQVKEQLKVLREKKAQKEKQDKEAVRKMEAKKADLAKRQRLADERFVTVVLSFLAPNRD